MCKMRGHQRARKNNSPKFRQDPDMHRESVDANSEFSWTPELFGPVFRNEKISLRQVLQTYLTDRRTKMMATFVPDELIYALDLTKKNFREFIAVMLLVDVSAFNSLWERFSYAENHGSNGFSSILNSYTSIVVEDIYTSEGDIIKISAQGITAMWKVRKDEFIAKTVDTVIECALHLQSIMEYFGDGSKSLTKVKMAISTGVVAFSVIGNEEQRDFVFVGEPVTELRRAKKNCVPGDVVLTESAWSHVSPENYEFVLRDAYNVKIIRVKEDSLKFNGKLETHSALPSETLSYPAKNMSATKSNKQESSTSTNRISNVSMLNSSMEESELERKIFTGRFSMGEATRRKLGTHLKSFSKNPVLRQIEKDLPMEHLTETRRVTVVVINLELTSTSVYDVVTLIDQCYILLCSIVSDHFGCVNAVTTCARDVNFIVIFGLLGFATRDDSKHGILCAMKSVRALKCVPGVRGSSVGIATGMVYCGVIGHADRMEYMILGPPVEKAIAIMSISSDKISCEFDTIFHSRFPQKKIRSRGLRELKGFGRCHLYEIVEEKSIGEGSDDLADVGYFYPILGRFRELDSFTDVLDDICASDRTYCGFLIEGPGRIGKSRLLDEIMMIAKCRQISVHKLCLHESDASKPYSTVHRLLLDLLDARDCKTIEDRERAITRNLCNIMPCDDFCYTNIMMRVKFPLSVNYVSKSEEERLARSLTIFGALLKSLRGPRCILIDDVQHIDPMSWRFISRSMDNRRIVLAMATQEITFSKSFGGSDSSIGGDKRIFRCKLHALESKHISSLVCQLLNVQAIPRKLDNTFKTRSGNHPGWCEAFLALLLQREALDVLLLTPDEASREDLIFPHPRSVSKIPKDVSPEDVTLELPWPYGKGNVTVCLTNEKFREDTDADLEIEGIRRVIYDRSAPHEQMMLQCAATLGHVFTRYMLQNILPHPAALYTARAVSRMMDMKILECASNNRQDFKTDEKTLCTNMERSTFSDMQHILQCSCTIPNLRSVGELPHYSQCRFLEFKVAAFREFIYEQLTISQRRQFHSKAAEIYERDARRCTSCGGGLFVRIPGRERPVAARKSFDGFPGFKPKRRSFLSISNDELKTRPSETEVRRISIMPTYSESDEAESTPSVEAMNMVVSVRRFSGIRDVDELSKFRKRASACVLAAGNDPSRISHLKIFNHIDFRNCRCSEIIDCLFWKLYQHLKVIGHSERLVRFMIDYSAGLIETGQSFQAVVLLAAAYDENESSSLDVRLPEINPEDRRINRSAILALTGDASMNLGNLAQARMYYTEAILLGVDGNRTQNTKCLSYRTFDESCKQRLHQRYPDLFVNRVTGSHVITKLSAASYLARLSIALLETGQTATSQLAALQSFNSAFSCSGSFLEKCDIYRKVTGIFRDLDNLPYARRLEKPMIYTIRSKHWWSDAEEVTAVGVIFKTIFEIRPNYLNRLRLLHGEYEDALLMGIRVLKISGMLKMSRTKLVILPQLIQLTIRTKRIHETVDLMRALYHSAPEDIDESSITWYYALCLDLAIDAGMILESFETCMEYARKITTRSKFGACVSRDPDSLRRLFTCLWIWQLRMGVPVTGNFAQTSKSCTRDIRADNFCHVLTLAKALECYLLILMRCINMKRGDQLAPLLNDIESIVKVLERVSKTTLFIKPRLYVLKAYFEIVHGRKLSAMRYLRKGSKCATRQGNILMLAWIRQNERAWTLKQFTNMTQYWVEHVGSNDGCDWQNMDCFDIKAWSSTLYPIPVPDTCLG